MKTIWKIIIVSVIAGLILVVLGLSMGASGTLYWDNKGVRVADDGESRITEPDLGHIKSIYIKADFCDVEFISSDHYGIDACSYGTKWVWTLEDEILKIEQKRTVDIQIINIGWSRQQYQRNYLNVYLPGGAQLATVDINAESANIDIGNFRADSVQIANSFGKVGLQYVTSGNLQIDLESGDFTGSNLDTRNLLFRSSFGKGYFQAVNAERYTADCDSVDLDLVGCRFGEIVITNDFGAITGRELISSRADININSGNISLDGDFSGETVLRSEFGKVKLSTSRVKDEYSYEISTSFGFIAIDGEQTSGFGGSSLIKSGGESENSLKIATSSGDVEVAFAK